MAQRRMFSKDITEHDNFLDMPLSSQALYFHLGMQADDDGFVSPNRIARMLGCQNDDLKLLIAKRFILSFDDGVVVIKHWKMNNYIQKDRYRPTKHVENMALLKVKSNSVYTLDTECIQNVRVGKVSKGKVISDSNESAQLKVNQKDMWNKHSEDFEEGVVDLDSGELKEEKKKDTRKYPNAPTIRKIFQEIQGRNPLAWKQNKNQLQACENLYTERTAQKVKNALEWYEENKDREFCPKISSPWDLDSKWTKLGEFKQSL